MSNEDVLQEYSNSIKNIKKQCGDAGMSEEEFKRIYFQSLKSLRSTEHIETSRPRRYNKSYRMLFIGIVIVLLCIYNFKVIYSTVMCNVQEYIYPGLKLLRRVSIPLISLFPSLTDLYHDTCIVQNPFFTVVDMDCWPCSTVTNVMEIDNPKPVSEQHNIPFIYETKQQVINMATLKSIYMKNRDLFNKESPKILTNGKYYQTAEELFDQRLADEKNFYIWKFNNIKVAKLLRQVIPRPKVVPKFGQSTERFILIDNSQQLFHVPDTECSHSFLLALSGTRQIHLLPAEECKHQCKILKVTLKETYLLWYNWWYWRPAVQTSIGNQTFIAHVGSYC